MIRPGSVWEMASWQLRRRRRSRRVTIFAVALLVAFLLSTTAEAQRPGWLSIDCGATSGYNDSSGITWQPDDAFVKTGLISSNVTSQLYESTSRYSSLRFFPQRRTKFCYELPAQNGTSYIVRTTFLYGNYDGRPRSPTFEVHIDSLKVGLVQATSPGAVTVIEVITVAVANNIFVCLAPNVPGTDVPFINFIELRPLADTMYLMARQGYMMITSSRFNYGGEKLSYPDDEYDRQWNSTPIPDGLYTSRSRAGALTLSPQLCPDEPPEGVMRTALVWPKEVIYSLPFNVIGDRNYVVLLWLAEVDAQVERRTREFQVAIDGAWQEPINVANVSGGLYQGYEWGYASVALNSDSAIQFRATDRSDLGPIINGFEVYAVSDPVQPLTDTQDVAAVESIKAHWNLSSWTGDPCLNRPYDWTSCSVDGTPRITKLALAGYKLTGSVPELGLLNLTELTSLLLENNTLTGSIPDLSSLTKLQQFHLQNNDLTGEFPAWVVNLPGLQELFLDGNNLTGSVPPSLLRKPGLKMTLTGNPSLCNDTPTLCSTPQAANSTASAPGSSEKISSTIIAIACVAGILALAAASIAVALLLLWRKRKQKRKEFFASGGCEPDLDTKAPTMALSFDEVKAATQNFKDFLGEGSFGPIYRGMLFDGREVAVKRCRDTHKLPPAEFFEEVELLARIHHKNLANLAGYCRDAQEQILIYEYKANSDLRTHLHGNGKLIPWKTRLTIALDTALGLEYLHRSCNPSIIHRDVKPANILLTGRMTAKVANFGLPKFTSEKDPALKAYSMDVKCTAGYLDPEYATSKQLTEKSDVYGFGVVLLELISGQEAVNKQVSDRNPVLIEWMRPLLGAGDLKAVVDPSLENKYNSECMWKMAELGMVSVEPKAFNRPTMSDAVREIRDAIALEEAVSAPSSPFSLASVASRAH